MFGNLLLACNGGGSSGISGILQQTINNPSPASGDLFGLSVSLYQDTLVVGVPNDDTGDSNSGIVYVYTRSGTTWTLQQTINNPTPAYYDKFGDSVSLYQDTLVIGAVLDSTGATYTGSVYVYVRSGSTWSLQQTINNPTPENYDNFGDSVSLYQDTLVVGASGVQSSLNYNTGAFYVYVRSGMTWTLQQEIKNPLLNGTSYFGMFVSLYDETIAIGDITFTLNGIAWAGVVHIYTRSGSTWSLQQTINNPSPGYDDEFGWSVSLYGDTLVVGAPWDDTVAEDAGSVYVYIRSGTSWSLQQTIYNPSPGYDDEFGLSVSLYQDTLVIGAPYDDTGATDAGSVYVYKRSGTTWSLLRTINNPSPANDSFGYSVSLQQDTLVVGACDDDAGASNAGSVYVYK